MPTRLLLYFNKTQDRTKYQLMKEVRRIAYQYSSGPYIHLWIQRGLVPNRIGQLYAHLRILIPEKQEFQRIYQRFSSQEQRAFESKWPNTARQISIMWDFQGNKFGNYTLCLCDYKLSHDEIKKITAKEITP